MFRRLVGVMSLTGFVMSGLYPVSSFANVILKNGNFFLGYTDVAYSGGFEPKVERIYNSKTPHKGVFGWGWGFEYEVYLTVAPDGSVIVHEYGGGADNMFTPVNQKSMDLSQAIDSIVKAAQTSGSVGNAEQLAKYKQKLKSDITFRNDEWEKFRAQGKVQAHQLENGTQFQSTRFSYQFLTKVPGGYVRTFDTGNVQKFNDAGKLVRISEKNNNYIDFTYGKDGHLQKLVDNFNRKIFFEFDNKGQVAKIEGENGKKGEYRYNPRGELIYSRDTDGNAYTFKYDAEGRHNMTQVGYADKTTMDIAYYGRDKFENVKSLKERDGTETEYLYDNFGADRSHYSITVKAKGPEDKSASVSKYEYFVKTKASGEEWTQKLITELDGDRTETTYNECCGLPLVIKHGSEETTFEYDVKGHVIKKTTPNEVTLLSYDKVVGKVDKVTHLSRPDNKEMNTSEFQYDKKGNLRSAKNSLGKSATLFYDESGRIVAMVDQSKRRINFKYNENSKPVEITDPALGSIHVNYSNSGEIKDVQSTAGRKVAMEVTMAFQNLLDIIRPAGVTLSF
jgi:YD repeat-containing protein